MPPITMHADADNADGPPFRFDVVTVVLAPGEAEGHVRRTQLSRGAFLAPDDFADEA